MSDPTLTPEMQQALDIAHAAMKQSAIKQATNQVDAQRSKGQPVVHPPVSAQSTQNAPSATIPSSDERASPTPEQAGILGLSGGDVGGIAPATLEQPGQVNAGHVTPSISTPPVPPGAPPISPVSTPINSAGPLVAKAAPTVKDMIANILSGHTGPEGEAVVQNLNTSDKKGGPNFGDILKGAGGMLGDFLQRWGMGLMGAPTGQTRGDILQAQQFELQKQQMMNTYAQTMLKQQYALSNQNAQELANLQNQLKMKDLPEETQNSIKARVAEINADEAARERFLGPEWKQRILGMGMQGKSALDYAIGGGKD